MPAPLLRHDVLRSMGGVGTAALAAQLIALAAAPIATRLFTEEAFGQYGLFLSVANILVPVVLLGLPDAILAAREDTDARALRAAAAWTIGALALPLALLVLGLIRADAFGLGILPLSAAALVLVEVPAMAWSMTLQAWTIRHREFRRLAISHLAQGTGRAGGQVGLGAAGLGFSGLALAEVLCRLAIVAVLGRTRNDGSAPAINFRAVKDTVKRYRTFPLYRTPSMLANNVGTALPALLVATRYGAVATGLFTLMATVIMAPLGLVQKAVGDVFLGHFADRHRSSPAEAGLFLRRVALALAALAVVPGVVLWWAGPAAFALVFGESWRPAGTLASLMAPVLVVNVAVGPLGGVLNVVHRPELKLLFDAAQIAAALAAYGTALSLGLSLEGMVRLLAWFTVVAFLLYGGLIWQAVRRPGSAAQP